MKKKYAKYELGRILLEVSRTVSSTIELDKVVDLVLKESRAALGADHASLFLMDDSLGRLVLTQAIGFSGDETDNIKVLGSWELITDQLVKKGKPFVVNDIHKNDSFRKKRLAFFHEKMPIKSFLAVPLKKGDRTVGALIVSNEKRPGHLFRDQDKKLMYALSNHLAIALLNAKLYKDLRDLFLSTVKSLVRAIEAKDEYTSGHSERVMKYATAIGKELGIEGQEIEDLGLSSLLHDVGKIGVRDEILTKAGKLAWRERDEVAKHSEIGVDIVKDVAGSHKIIRGILDHHERYDGKGYPRGLKGGAISLAGRIIAVADTFDALTSTRSYRKRCTPKEAVMEITENSSTQFDPKIVRSFLKSFSRQNDIWKIQGR